VASGAGVLARGTVLGKIKSSGKYVVANSANTDGSQLGICVLKDGIDATGADVIATVYWSGVFNREHLIFGGADTADIQEDSLRDVDILLTSEK
jgi:hypothetical protein